MLEELWLCEPQVEAEGEPEEDHGKGEAEKGTGGWVGSGGQHQHVGHTAPAKIRSLNTI